jgi:tetratricopeptide (TPR) repeat protein
MGLVNQYRWGNTTNIPVSKIEIDSLATLESIKSRQGWMIAAQVATVAAIANQTKQTTDAIRLVNDTLISIDDTIQNGFDSLESSIERLESNLIENLNEIKWYLFNVDQKLDQLINLIKFSGATKSAEYNKQGFILYKIETYEDAIEQFNRSLKENPLNIEAYINLGFVYLRIEDLEKSIHNFEKALKLIKEDFSYFEEISAERIDSTEIFILDNLTTLYGLKKSYDQSTEALNKILKKPIDKKTEVLSKYKLAKYLCLVGNTEEALSIIQELINNQYFEPVALAVSCPEFSSINLKILDVLQSKLEDVKKSFELEGTIVLDKLDSMGIEEDTHGKLKNIVAELNNQINNSTEYNLLLTTEFKESHFDFLQAINMLSELMDRAQSDISISKQDMLKLESISKFNSEMNSDYSHDDAVLVLSHKILLSKIKEQVKQGIGTKVKEYNSLILLHEDVMLRVNRQVSEFEKLAKTDLLKYLKDGFKIVDIATNVTPILNDDGIYGFYLDYKNYIQRFLPQADAPHKDGSEDAEMNDSNLEDQETLMQYAESKDFDPDDRDPLFEDAARIIVMHQQASTSLIQRKLKLGYIRAGRIMDQLEGARIVGPFEGSVAREVLIPDENALDLLLDILSLKMR